MGKRHKTARELADMIADVIGVSGVYIVVRPDGAQEWRPLVLAAPSQTFAIQQLADNIAAQMRSLYDLKL